MSARQCEHCRQTFKLDPRYKFATLCFTCLAKRKTALAEYDAMNGRLQSQRRRLDELRAENHQLRKSQKNEATDELSDKELKWMMSKIHPDKNGGSEYSHKISQWINKQRQGSGR